MQNDALHAEVKVQDDALHADVHALHVCLWSSNLSWLETHLSMLCDALT
jgi:hypothetical protein